MNTLQIEIETAIRPVSWATVQVGQKSLQRITVDFAERRVTSQYLTGKTHVLLLELDSVRNDFRLIAPVFSPSGRASFSVSGQTATGVRVLPDIDYRFSFEVSPNEVRFQGCHDGYPSYRIAVDGETAYDYVQGCMVQLAGRADVTVQPQVFRAKAKAAH